MPGQSYLVDAVCARTASPEDLFYRCRRVCSASSAVEFVPLADVHAKKGLRYTLGSTTTLPVQSVVMPTWDVLKAKPVTVKAKANAKALKVPTAGQLYTKELKGYSDVPLEDGLAIHHSWIFGASGVDASKLKAGTKVLEAATGNVYHIVSIVQNKTSLEYFYKCRNDNNISTQYSFFPVDDVLTFNRAGPKQLFSIVTRRNNN